MSHAFIYLLKRYFKSYGRSPKRLLNDAIFAVITTFALIEWTIILPNLDYYSYLVSSFAYSVVIASIVGEITTEKSSRTKSLTKSNGVSSLTYEIYIIIIVLVKTTFFTLFITITDLYIPFPQQNEYAARVLCHDAYQFLQIYILQIIGLSSFILLTTPWFTNAKNSFIVSSTVYFVMSIFAFYGEPIFKEAYSIYVVFIPSLFLEFGKGINYDGWLDPAFNAAWLVFLASIFAHLYWDQVLKDENGIRKPLFFFIKYFKIPRKTRNDPTSECFLNENNQEETIRNQETRTSSAIYEEVILGDKDRTTNKIEVREIVKCFKKITAVDNVSFPVYQGQIFCLLGENGAGKTTTINMILGRLKSDHGEILYNGKKFDEDVKAKVGVCAEKDVFFERLTVKEHLEFIAKLRRIPPNEVETAVNVALEKMDLKSDQDKYTEQLSAGIKRKLSIAMAIIGDIKILFLDEPTSGVDPQNRRVLWRLLRQLRKDGMTIFLTTHHLGEAEELSDRIGIMSKGKLMAYGTCDFLINRFAEGYSFRITVACDDEDYKSLREKLSEKILDIIPTAKVEKQSSKRILRISVPFAMQKEYIELLKGLENDESIKIVINKNSLEDVFFSDKFLNEEHSQSLDSQARVIPSELYPSMSNYRTIDQIIPLIKRRIRLLLRSRISIFLIIFPALLSFVIIIPSVQWRREPDLILTIIIIGYTFKIVACCSFLVSERENRLRHLMYTMGMSKSCYWVANVLVDTIITSIINFAVFGIANQIFSVSSISGALTSWVLHGISVVAFEYVWSFVFDSSLSVFRFFPSIYLFALLPIGLGLSYITPDFVFLGFEVLGGLVCPTSLFYITLLKKYSSDSQQYFRTDDYLSGELIAQSWTGSILCFIAYTIIYIIIIAILESRTLPYENAKLKQEHDQSRTSSPNLDNARIEKVRILQSKGKDKQDSIRAWNVSKVYNKTSLALKKVTFGVEPGQIFSFLGPNGSGKSTIMDILTAHTHRSGGFVEILSTRVTSNTSEVFRDVGVCPGYYALWDNLTVKEHLSLFGSLKGLKGQDLSQAVDYHLSALCLKDFANKRASQLSKGNKRKLSIAISFMGLPHAIFLDEPSSGLDPFARRALRQSIQQLVERRGASILLTTHSISEAELLSDKVGILSRGQLVEIGLLHDVKNRYNDGYNVAVSLVSEDKNPESEILQIFKNATRSDDQNLNKQIYHIPYMENEIRLSECFEKLKELQTRRLIKDFSVYSKTLEEIFLDLTRPALARNGNDESCFDISVS